MERKIILGILGVTLIAIALAIVLPGGRTVDEQPKLPWLIEIDVAGYPSVFGVTLGKTSLQEVRNRFREQGEINLFRSGDGRFSVEAYFERLYLSGIRADMIITLDLDQAGMEQMYDRGLRISQMESGGKKIKLAESDVIALEQAIIDHIAYLPAADLDDELIASRFGEPDQRITEESSGLVHWLYPEKGLDIAVNPDGKEVFQYLIPANFKQALEPLTRGATDRDTK